MVGRIFAYNSSDMKTLFPTITNGLLIILVLICYQIVWKRIRAATIAAGWDSARSQRLTSRVLIALLGWGALTALLALTGFLSDFTVFPPRLMIVLAVPLITLLAVTFSSTTRELLPFVPADQLIRLQSFRIAVEILLWMAFLQDRLPEQMTFEGRNFDVFSGLLALVASRFAGNRWIVIGYNLLSLALLINIVTVAILSLPSPFRYFMNEPANTIVTYFPFVWLPAFLVPLAYGLHFLSLRKLAIQR